MCLAKVPSGPRGGVPALGLLACLTWCFPVHAQGPLAKCSRPFILMTTRATLSNVLCCLVTPHARSSRLSRGAPGEGSLALPDHQHPLSRVFADPGEVRSAYREAKLLGKMDDKHIVRFHHVWHETTQDYKLEDFEEEEEDDEEKEESKGGGDQLAVLQVPEHQPPLCSAVPRRERDVPAAEASHGAFSEDGALRQGPVGADQGK